MSYGYPTTRRYHRTMMDAFQQDQAQWWFPPEKSASSQVWLYACITFFLCSILFALGTS